MDIRRRQAAVPAHRPRAAHGADHVGVEPVCADRGSAMTTGKLLTGGLATAVLAILTAGIAAAGPPPDKSGGTAPVELTLLNTDTDFYGVPAVKRFIDRVADLSDGSVTIDAREFN